MEVASVCEQSSKLIILDYVFGTIWFDYLEVFMCQI